MITKTDKQQILSEIAIQYKKDFGKLRNDKIERDGYFIMGFVGGVLDKLITNGSNISKKCILLSKGEKISYQEMLESRIGTILVKSLPYIYNTEIDMPEHAIIPNVSWGLGLFHEADLLVLDKQNRLTEIEIKITIADLKADFNKKYFHSGKIISRLVYAIPENLLEQALILIPKKYGIITVNYSEEYNSGQAKWYRISKHQVNVYTGQIETPTDDQIKTLLFLGCMRIWTLKNHYHTKLK
jgi:hypothetical protein